MSNRPEQFLIVYSNKQGKDTFYTTGYTDRQCRQGVINCANEHGTFANVRCAPASQYPVT